MYKRRKCERTETPVCSRTERLMRMFMSLRATLSARVSVTTIRCSGWTLQKRRDLISSNTLHK